MKSIAIIGSGFSSLCLSALLLKQGYKVDIYEQAKSIGGYAQTLSIDGYTFSYGPRYLWEFGKDDMGSRFFEYLGCLSYKDFVQLNKECFDEIYIGSELAMRVPMGWNLYRERMIDTFPAEKDGINRFFLNCENIFTLFSSYIEHNLDYKGFGALFRYMLTSKNTIHQIKIFGQYAFKTLQQEFNACSLSNRVRSILSAHLAIVVECPHDMSFVGYAIATLNYHRGSYYPKKHMHFLVDVLIEYIEKCGGTFHLESKVSSLILKNNRIKTLIFNGEGKKNADIFISNIDPEQTMMMIDGPAKPKKKFYERSNSLLSFFIGCEVQDNASFPFNRAQKWYLKNENIFKNPIFDKRRQDNLNEPEYMYLNSPSTFSKYGKLGPTAQSRVITGFVPSSYYTFVDKSSRDIEDYHYQRKESILSLIDRNLWNNCSRTIKTFSLFTPMDNYTTFHAPEGHIYGKRFRAKDIFIYRIPFHSRIKNLKFCSAFSNSPGLASCIRGACYLFEEITGAKKIF